MKKILLVSIIALVALTAHAQQVQHITKAQFLDLVWNYEANPQTWVYRGKLPCIVDFYASWCGPCKRLAPILEELQQEYAGRIVIYKVNTEAERELAGAWGIQSIPTLLFCPMTGQPTMSKGLLPKENLKQVIETNLLR